MGKTNMKLSILFQAALGYNYGLNRFGYNGFSHGFGLARDHQISSVAATAMLEHVARKARMVEFLSEAERKKADKKKKKDDKQKKKDDRKKKKEGKKQEKDQKKKNKEEKKKKRGDKKKDKKGKKNKSEMDY